MAANMYDLGRQGILDGSFDLLTNNIKAVLVSAGYTRNLATDQFLSSISGGDRIATSGNLASKTVTNGVFDAADTLVAAVPAGTPVTQVVIYYDTGAAATSRLIANWDAGTGLPMSPNGSDITIVWDSGTNKIFNWQAA